MIEYIQAALTGAARGSLISIPILICYFGIYICDLLNGILQQLKELNAKADLIIWKDPELQNSEIDKTPSRWVRICIHPDHEIAKVKRSPSTALPGYFETPQAPGT